MNTFAGIHGRTVKLWLENVPSTTVNVIRNFPTGGCTRNGLHNVSYTTDQYVVARQCSTWESFVPSHSNPFSFPSPQFYNYCVTSSWLATLHLDSFLFSPSFLALPLHLRQQYSEHAVTAASHLQSFQPPSDPS